MAVCRPNTRLNTIQLNDLSVWTIKSECVPQWFCACVLRAPKQLRYIYSLRSSAAPNSTQRKIQIEWNRKFAIRKRPMHTIEFESAARYLMSTKRLRAHFMSRLAHKILITCFRLEKFAVAGRVRVLFYAFLWLLGELFYRRRCSPRTIKRVIVCLIGSRISSPTVSGPIHQHTILRTFTSPFYVCAAPNTQFSLHPSASIRHRVVAALRSLRLEHCDRHDWFDNKNWFGILLSFGSRAAGILVAKFLVLTFHCPR